MRRAHRLLEALDLNRKWIGVAILFCLPMLAAGAALGVTTEDVTQHNGLATSDAQRLQLFVSHRSDALVHAAKVVTELGSIAVLLPLALVAAAALWWTGQRLIVAVAPGVALVGAAALASAAKTVVARPRPPGGLLFETEPSFPSGHSTDSAAFYLALGLIVAVFVLRRPLARAAVVLAGALTTTFVGVTRLVLGVHWPSDVLAGWSLGTLVAFGTIGFVVLVARWTPPPATGPVIWRARLVALLYTTRRVDPQMA